MVPTLLVWVGMNKILGAELIVFYSKKKHDYLEPMVDFVQWSVLFKLKWLVLIF